MLKEPKIYPYNNLRSAYSNIVNRAEILNEKAVYERLETHYRIIYCFKYLEGLIKLAFANQGELLTYCRPESEFLSTIVLLSDDLDRLYELCLRCLSAYDEMSHRASRYLFPLTMTY
jgi:hypothetical protein